MANYCVRCGYKVGLFRHTNLLNGEKICNSCLEELGIREKSTYRVENGSYEMLLLGARLQNSNVNYLPGERTGTDYVEPKPLPVIRSAAEILEQDYLIPKDKLPRNVQRELSTYENCYCQCNVNLSTVLKRTIKEASHYKGVRIGLGHGLSYSIGERVPGKTRTVNETKNVISNVYLTSSRLIIEVNNQLSFVPYGVFDAIYKSPGSFDIEDNEGTLHFSSIFKNNFFPVYSLIMLHQKELETNAKQIKVNSKTTHQKKSSAQSEPKKSNPALIREYKQLYDDGIISKEEFEQKKEELLRGKG